MHKYAYIKSCKTRITSISKKDACDGFTFFPWAESTVLENWTPRG